jgi:excisionase family DNA binding protein
VRLAIEIDDRDVAAVVAQVRHQYQGHTVASEQLARGSPDVHPSATSFEKRLLSIPEVARQLGTAKAFVCELTRKGTLASVKLGRLGAFA